MSAGDNGALCASPHATNKTFRPERPVNNRTREMSPLIILSICRRMVVVCVFVLYRCVRYLHFADASGFALARINPIHIIRCDDDSSTQYRNSNGDGDDDDDNDHRIGLHFRNMRAHRIIAVCVHVCVCTRAHTRAL